MSYIGNIPGENFISFAKQNFTIVNSQTAYTLNFSVADENEIRLVINNVVQEPGSGKAYTASGTTLTLSSALTNGTDEMYCVFLGKARETVTVPTITKDKVNFISDSSSSGVISKGDGSVDGSISLNCSQNSHFTKISSAAHGAYSGNLNFVLPSSHGSSGQLMKTDGSGNLSFVDAPSGKFNVVRSASFSSGDAYMEMTNAFNSTYRNYLVKMEQLKPSDDGADLRVEFGQSDGTYSAAANFGARMYMYNGNLHNYGGTNATGFTPTWSMDNGAWHNVEMYVYDPMSTTDGKHQYVFLSESKRYDEEYGAVYGGGMYGVAAALPRLKVRVNNGTFSEGRITVYGITNTGNV